MGSTHGGLHKSVSQTDDLSPNCVNKVWIFHDLNGQTPDRTKTGRFGPDCGTGDRQCQTSGNRVAGGTGTRGYPLSPGIDSVSNQHFRFPFVYP